MTGACNDITKTEESDMTTVVQVPIAVAERGPCAHCAAPMPEDRDPIATYCSPSCVKRARRRRTRRRDYLRTAKASRSIEAVAAHLAMTVEEARTRAAHDIMAGRLVGWWEDGVLAEISTPRGRAR